MRHCQPVSRDDLYHAYAVLGLSIQEIADRFGYADASGINRCLRRFGIPRTRGTHFHHTPRRSDAHSVPLSEVQKAIIVGSLLGDGHLARSTGGANYSLRINQSVEHLGYLRWLFTALSPFSRNLHVGERLAQMYVSTHPWLTELRAMFYLDGQKCVTREALALSSWPAMTAAIFYMDDGSYNQRVKYAVFCTHGFDLASQEILSEWFRDALGVTCSLRRHYDQHFLALTVAETRKFFRQMDPLLVPSMRYKLGL